MTADDISVIKSPYCLEARWEQCSSFIGLVGIIKCRTTTGNKSSLGNHAITTALHLPNQSVS